MSSNDHWIAMATDRLLTEVQRQKKYLERLGGDYTFPLFNSRHALESQRRSGYRHTTAAAREIVDNAIEAGATPTERQRRPDFALHTHGVYAGSGKRGVR